MSKIHLKSSNYNEETGVSTVVIDGRHGTYTATSRLHPDDRDHDSKFFGCQLAERRAIAKMIKRRLEDAKCQLKIMNEFYNTAQGMRNFNPRSAESYHARKVIKELNKKIEFFELQLKAMAESDKTLIEMRDHYNWDKQS